MGKYVDKLCIGEFEETSNFDQIPWPDYEGFGIDEYHRRHEARYMGVLTSRGCPFNCTFCVQTCRFRQRKLEKVFGEIQYYKSKYKIDTVVFNDNTLNVSKARFMKICWWMKGRGLSWSAAIRCDVFDEEMAKAAKESGCSYFVVGVESFMQSKLDKMNKRIKVKDIYKTLDLLHKYGIKYHGNILLGFEDETYLNIATEVNKVPRKYNVFPTLVQPFVGTNNGAIRLLTDDEVMHLSTSFSDYALSQNMYHYSATDLRSN